MTLATKDFFDNIRNKLFGGKLNQSQVSGLNSLILTAEAMGMSDYRQIAYLLATAFHETAFTMQPIAEYGKGRGKKYSEVINGKVYYGRGYCQLTWIDNYRKMSSVVCVDLVKNPDLAMESDIAAKIIVHGMMVGSFTGKKLGDYIKCGKKPDYIGSRRIINGVDKASLIASYASIFEEALS